MPLFLAELGVLYTIVRLAGNEKLRHRMESLGFLTGAELVLVSKFNNYFLISIKGSRIGISEDMAKRIIVRQEVI
ncbi:MAG: FeoA family protein [Lacrimispora sp.]|uniref:FeoA family protein n=1 Tax=Lacrimispora sp. TaxID=2719234 RepID=UPI0039E63813